MMLLSRPCFTVRAIPQMLILGCLLTACGGAYQTEKIKEYKLAVVQGPEEMKSEFAQLIKDFNAQAGIDVLTYVDDASQANSAIIITEGLRERDGKVGWGQWMSEQNTSNPLINISGQNPTRTIRYAMRLEFDAEYFRSRIKDKTDKTSYEMQKLFFHETGHGLTMNHVNDDVRNLMYPDITGEKDFSQFFVQVRQFMQE